MIKRLPHQQEKSIICIKTKSIEIGYQCYISNMNPPRPFGGILCRISDKCEVLKCPYHNKNVNE